MAVKTKSTPRYVTLFHLLMILGIVTGLLQLLSCFYQQLIGPVVDKLLRLFTSTHYW